ncbi:ORF6N domain-containing protein [Acinetobacter johnsonii]|uniref:ORF6N domain-containing protein n=1 Tax=Acinetobacter johnsonii TaxID=40214 RepID=A0A427UJC3_ACIJO|nr:ORF6N domain-containing protein [Acinetobacter johnsonii]RSE16741.1 ORF6N domain-containing protein [Acinetobacter johnsonii]
MSTQISAPKNQVIRFKNVPVVTTAQLAEFYGVDVNNIQQNFKRNASRFIQGKHYFKIEGAELRELKNQPSLRGLVDSSDRLTESQFVKKNAKSLIVWTERGAARHAKMLDTDHAWDVFESLEDNYFKTEQTAPAVAEKTPYRQTGNDLYLPKAEGRYFVENKKDGTLIVRQADQYTMIRRAQLDVVKKDCQTIIQELELFSRSLERLGDSLELDADLLPILGRLNWRGV